jgi:hypothetical protein
VSFQDEQFKTWAGDFESLYDEVWHLLISRATLKQVAAFFEEKRSSYDAAALDWYMKWNGSMWGVATSARLRALADPDTNTKSLRTLLDKVRRHPEVFTRERYVAMAGSNDSPTRERSNREFDEHFGAGAAVEPARVERDIAALDAAMEKVRPFVDKRIAHLDPGWTEMRLQYGPIYEALDVLDDLMRKYVLLFRGNYGSGQFGALTQFDARMIFEPGGR